MRASRRTTPAWARAALPRTSSSASGFCFCGIRLDPVVNASGSTKNPNSGEESQMRSSARRERWVWSCAPAKTNSAAKSRSMTASSALGENASNPRSRASASRSRGTAVPASAPEPSGSTLTRRRASPRRSWSRTSPQACPAMKCPRVIGSATRVWVKPGITASAPLVPLSTMARTRAAVSARSRSMAPRIQRRRAVTVCSLRLRPRWAWPARSPMRSVRRASTQLWTSSSTAPASASGVTVARISARPPSRVAASAAEMAPARARAAT